MDTSTAVLVLRVAVALGAVLALLWFIGRRTAGKSPGRRNATRPMTVLARQSLGGRTGVALVEVGGRSLVLGVSEHGVTLLTEVRADSPADAAELPAAELPAAASVVAHAADRSTPDVAQLEHLMSLDAVEPDRTPTTPSIAAARTPAVPTPRSPLEGSILDAATWRRAVAAVQERTVRR